ncbi:MAG TPA: parallel beta-helix domain-containing protein [Candidatus Limnocylindrales bacterium]|nr:parallel beta-helix domain-containing protein [Candidatus Limnocylindrales bacterium]
MKKVLSRGAAVAVSLAFASVAGAAADGPTYCKDHAAPTITAPTGGSVACQSAITKASQKFVKAVVKTRGKCILKRDYTACPNTKDDEKVAKAAIKAQETIAAACGDTSGLGSSYDGVGGSDVGSCTLSQHHGTAEVFVGLTHGIPANIVSANEDCGAEIGKVAQKTLASVLKVVDKCIEGKIKAGDTGDIGEACVGSISGGVITAPTDGDTDAALDALFAKSSASLIDACGSLSEANIVALTACPGATTAEHVAECVTCSVFDAVNEIVDQQYAETGTLVTNGAGAIQTAVDAAATGDKLLVQSGTYNESVHIPSATCNGGDNDGLSCLGDSECPGGGVCESPADNLAIVGCGAAADNRPVLEPPLMGADPNGITAAGVDGLHFQALELRGWDENGVFATNADGISFRDIYGDGATADDDFSVYAVFPVVSRNVVVEGSEVINVRDAGIYVGQSEDITVRFNDVHDNVTGIEIENSLTADVYGNTATANTGGILSFKLPGPAIQTHGFHNFFDNLSYANNTPNFAIPGSTVSAVLPGTGFMIISDDDSVYRHNFLRDNDTFGFAILDQEIINVLVEGPGPFEPTSPDQDTERLQFRNNNVRENGGNPDPSTEEFNSYGNWVFALSTDTNGTCFEGSTINPTFTLHEGSEAFPDCP